MVVNAGGSGFYRVRYAPRAAPPARPARWMLARPPGALHPARRHLGRRSSPSSAGLEDFLLLAEALGDEDDPDVWGQVSGALRSSTTPSTTTPAPSSPPTPAPCSTPGLARLGWDARPGEGDRTATLRAQVLGMLGTVGQDATVQAECAPAPRRRHRRRRRARPRPGLPIVGVVAAVGGPAEFEIFLERYRHPATPQEEIRYLYALAAFPDPALAARAFELARTEVRTQNAPFVVQLLLAHREHGPATWARVRDDWDELVDALPRQHPPADARRGAVCCAVTTPLADDVRRFIARPPGAERSAHRRPDPRTPRRQRGVRRRLRAGPARPGRRTRRLATR